ncbi:MAG TPA: TonB-dependent receptor [Bryobacteraceae bacterium]|nr:TonB-dependent receptor [Bryobacteraceae bacterium]
MVGYFVPAAFGGEIQGRVLNAQGGPVEGATVTAGVHAEPPRAKVVTAADGSYTVPNLEPGVYTVTVSLANLQQTLRQEVTVESEGAPARADFRFTASAEEVTGLEERNPNIFIYRIDLNDLRNLLTLFRGPNPTYIPEFLAEDNYFGAEFGAPLLSFQPLRPRTPLKDWHASISATHQNSALNARNFFNAGPLLPSRITSYDLVAGGPVISPKVSLLLDFGQLFNSGMVNGNIQAPLASERTPRASDPQTNAVIADLLKAYPAELPNLPSVSLRQLNTNAPRSIVTANGLARLDVEPDDKTSVAGLYSVNQYSEDPFQLVLGQNPQTDLRNQSAYADVTRTFSPQTIGQFGFHYDRIRASLLPTEQYSDLLAPLGFPVPQILFAGGATSQAELAQIGPGIQFPRLRVENRFKTFSSLSRTMGRHTLKFGGSATRSQVNDLQSNDGRGVLTFQSDFGRSAVDNFLMGTPDLFTIAIGNLYRGFRNWEDALYLEDQFRVSPTFVVNAGVRYEVETSPTEVNHLTDPKMPTGQGVAPRFGFAWNPGPGRLTIRAAYGISFGTIFPVSYQTTRFSPPAVQVLEINAPNLAQALTLAKAAPTMKPIPGAQQDLYLLSPDLVLPYTHMYNFSLEWALPSQTLVRVTYLGNRSIHLLDQGIYNRPVVVPGIPTTEATINKRRPDQRYGAINVVESNSINYYDAGQASIEKRLTRGLTFRAAYTFSKDIDLGGDFTNTASGVEVPPETGSPTCETCARVSDQKGPALFDTPQVFTFSYIYRLPFFAGSNRWPAAALKGWQISGTTLLQSGVAYHFHTGSDAPGYGNVDGDTQDRPNILNPSLLGKSLDNPDTVTALLGANTCRPPGTDGLPYLHCKYFDTNIPPGGRGNLGMNTFRKDGTANWNAAFGRTFPLPGGERSLDFRTEFINFFNTPQFDKPGVQVALATFGKITNTVNKGRQVQFTLKLNF